MYTCPAWFDDFKIADQRALNFSQLFNTFLQK